MARFLEVLGLGLIGAALGTGAWLFQFGDQPGVAVALTGHLVAGVAAVVLLTGRLRARPGRAALALTLFVVLGTGLAAALGLDDPLILGGHWVGLGLLVVALALNGAAKFGWALSLLMAIGAFGGLSMMRPTTALPADYERPFAADFLPSQVRLARSEALPPGYLGDPMSCGTANCHPTITRHWQSSTHRYAGTDEFYRFAVGRMAEDYGVAATRLCIGCHAPGEVLSGSIDRAGEPDLANRHAGVGCLTCHLTEEVLDVAPHGVPANGSLVIGRLDRAVLVPSGPLTPLWLARHRRALSRPTIRQNRFCAACHQFFVPGELGGAPVGRLRLQNAEGAALTDHDSLEGGYLSCVDCHMPLIKGADPAAKEGQIHDHRTLGANLMLSVQAGDTEQAEAIRAFRNDRWLSLSVGDAKSQGPKTLLVPVTVHNDGISHDFPTGATDVSEAWIQLEVLGDHEQIVARSPGLRPDGFLDPRTPTLSSVILLPGDEPDFLHDLFGQVKLAQHPRVHPGEGRVIQVPLNREELPQGGSFRVRARLFHRRGNQRWNTWTYEFRPTEMPVSQLAEVVAAVQIPPPQLPGVPVASPVAPEPGMVWVPPGAYVVGADWDDPEAELEEMPAHWVQSEGFFIDRVPVTSAQWGHAVRAGVAPPPPEHFEPGLSDVSWKGGHYSEAQADAPVALITALEAAAYCKWRHKRLPTNAEWEIAARGHTERTYPWGDIFDPARCNTSEALSHRLERVGMHRQNASPFGVLDLGCNISEWVSDDYVAYPQAVQPDNRDDWFSHFGPGMRTIRGASFLLSGQRSRVTSRSFEQEEERKIIGFRCVRGASKTSASEPGRRGGAR